MRLNAISRIGLVILTLLSFVSFAPGQGIIELSKEDAEKLQAQIDLLSNQIKAGNWGRVYEMLASELRSKWPSKKTFIVRMESKPNTFRAFGVAFMEGPAEKANIGGCLAVSENGSEVEYQAGLTARLGKDGKWRFLSLPDQYAYQIDGGRIVCHKQTWNSLIEPPGMALTTANPR